MLKPWLAACPCPPAQTAAAQSPAHLPQLRKGPPRRRAQLRKEPPRPFSRTGGGVLQLAHMGPVCGMLTAAAVAAAVAGTTMAAAVAGTTMAVAAAVAGTAMAVEKASSSFHAPPLIPLHLKLINGPLTRICPRITRSCG